MKFTAFLVLPLLLCAGFPAHAEGQEFTVGIQKVEYDPNGEGGLLHELEQAEMRKDEPASRAIADKLLALDSNNPRSLALYGMLEYATGHYEAARTRLERARELASNYPDPFEYENHGKFDLFMTLGKTYEVMNQKEKAAEAYRQLRPAGGFKHVGMERDKQVLDRLFVVTGACKIDEVELVRCQDPQALAGADQSMARAPASDVSGTVTAEK